MDQTINKSLGIGFSSDQIVFTELISETDSTKLNYTEAVKVDFNFEEELWKYKSSQKVLTNISSEIQKILHKRGTNFSNISLTIGTSQAFMIILPIEFAEGKQSINSRIYWELSNYFPETYNDYIVNTYRLNTQMPCSESDEFLVIAVPKNTLEFIKRIFKLCNIKLSLVDIDHFSAENALRKNYPELLENKKILLTGLKNGRFDFGYIVNKKYKYYTYTKYSSVPEYNLSLNRKIRDFLASNSGKDGIDLICVYGDEMREDTLESMKKHNDAKIMLLNPFENIHASSEYLQNESLRKTDYSFAASCGAALRNIVIKDAA